MSGTSIIAQIFVPLKIPTESILFINWLNQDVLIPPKGKQMQVVINGLVHCQRDA